jgi:hypothetical protein
MSLGLILMFAATAAATPPKPPAVDCHDQAHRALDFWIGEWTVFDTRSNTALAHSRIEPVMDGCAIRETYDQAVGPGGKAVDYHGTSYTALNALDGLWKQFYVDTRGGALAYAGGVQGDAMVLTASAGKVANRMTYRRLADGSVEQTGEISLDAGKTWIAGYDFTYRRVTAP